MLTVYFNSNGFYINGEQVEVSMACSPSYSEQGEAHYSEIHHLYAVLAKALNKIRDKNINEEVVVYNDSRIIDEMNGTLESADQLSNEFKLGIRREILPNVLANVFFRKKNNIVINREIAKGHGTMIREVDIKKLEKKQKDRKNRVLARFKQDNLHERN